MDLVFKEGVVSGEIGSAKGKLRSFSSESVDSYGEVSRF